MIEKRRARWRLLRALLVVAGLVVAAGTAGAGERPVYEIAIRGHRFVPAEITVPAGQKIKLVVHNEDATPEEVESYELNREKIVPGGAKMVIFVGPLAPGVYPFFGDFHQDTARGRLVAK